jgi:hypothetical protein
MKFRNTSYGNAVWLLTRIQKFQKFDVPNSQRRPGSSMASSRTLPAQLDHDRGCRVTAPAAVLRGYALFAEPGAPDGLSPPPASSGYGALEGKGRQGRQSRLPERSAPPSGVLCARNDDERIAYRIAPRPVYRSTNFFRHGALLPCPCVTARGGIIYTSSIISKETPHDR